MIQIYKNKTDRDKKISEHFRAGEFMCKCGKYCTETKLDSSLTDRLERLRGALGKAIHVNSGFRCPTHNKNIGGAAGSNHMKGMAADIRADGVDPLELARCAEAMGFLGVILYPAKRFVHVDTRSTRYFSTDDSKGTIKSLTTHGKPATKLSATPPAPPDKAAGGLHTVKAGDTLSSIAKKHNTTVLKLLSLNIIKNKDRILVGQIIRYK